MNAITPVTIIRMVERFFCLEALGKKSSSPHPPETLFIFGGSSRMTADRSELIVPSFGTKEKSSLLTLSERLTPSLISAGLVKGTTLTFGKRLLSRGIQGFVLFAPDGKELDIPKTSFLFSAEKESRNE
jgi:hypothetical protein